MKQSLRSNYDFNLARLKGEGIIAFPLFLLLFWRFFDKNQEGGFPREFFFSRKANVRSVSTDNSFKRCYRFERSHLFLRLTGLVDELTRTVNPPGRVRRNCVHCQDFDVMSSVSVDCVFCPGFVRFFFFFLFYQIFSPRAIQILKRYLFFFLSFSQKFLSNFLCVIQTLKWYLFEKFYV